MPPKSPKGGKKLSKAEKERLKREEAERKAEEDEQARIQAEKDAVAKKERDKVEAEERRRLENEERKKRKGQLHELEELWSSYRTTLVSQKAARRVKAKWDRYMLCDGSPNPTIPGEINTYIHLLREDHSKDTIQDVLQESRLILSLIDELEFLIKDTPPEEITEEEISRYKQTIKELQVLLQEKLDLASHHLSLQATALLDPETLNLQKTVAGDNITLCIWGNLSKNPRIKSYEFEEKGFQFEMPKLLTLSDIAFRILFSKFDHYSPYSKSYNIRIKQKIVEEPTTVTEDGEKEEGEKAEGEEDGDKKEGEQEGLSREETEAPQEDAQPEDSEKKEDVMAALRELEDGKEEDEEKKEEEPEEAEPMEEDYEIKTPEPTDYEDFDGDDDVLDLRAYSIMGGIFHFNLINLPPQPKQAKGWTLVQKVEPPALNFNDYEGDPPAETPKEDDKSEDITKAADKLLRKDDKAPIGITYKLPKDVYFFEEPQPLRWCPDTNEWKTDGFTDITFKEEERILSYKTRFFGTMALAQDKHINMPFQSWEIRPRAPNHVVITVIAAIVEVEMEVKDDKICLTQPADKTELEHLIGKWTSITEFVKAMQLAGVNLFPDEDSHRYVSIQNKPNSITEERLYQQMSMVASAMAFSWSRWNADCKDVEKLIIQGCEQLEDESLLEEDWSLFMITKKRTTKLKMTEFDETFSEDHAEGTEFHADLYHMTMDIASENAKNRIRETNHLFVDSMYQLLKHTKMVTYS